MKRSLLFLGLLLAAGPVTGTVPEISADEAARIGRLLWKNECGGTVEGLTSWNKGETFASLGIGHFIWYPPGQEGPFEESFPRLVAFIQSRGAKVPAWLLQTPDCPWPDREAFLAAKDSERMVSLRLFLRDTVGLQALFAAERLRAALPRMTAGLPGPQQDHIRRQFERVAAHPHGLYCLVDYVNFKGEGVKETERYRGEGWGLRQVLEGMTGTEPGAPALREFSTSAASVLRRRVAHSPPERGESRWLPGWENRCKTYLPPAP